MIFVSQIYCGCLSRVSLILDRIFALRYNIFGSTAVGCGREVRRDTVIVACSSVLQGRRADALSLLTIISKHIVGSRLCVRLTFSYLCGILFLASELPVSSGFTGSTDVSF